MVSFAGTLSERLPGIKNFAADVAGFERTRIAQFMINLIVQQTSGL
jgi:hypothetical protein